MNETNGMSVRVRRIIFFVLVSIYFIQSYFVYTSATEIDAGKAYLTEDAKKGKILFQEFNCISCHQLYGLGGYMGPDLTNVISAAGKGKEYASIFLRHGTYRMPNLHLTEKQISHLVAFLEYADKTGVSPLRTYTLEPDGSISLPEDK